MNIFPHPVDFTPEDFAKADHATRKEVVRFWQECGHPWKIPVFIERLICAVKHKDRRPLAFLGKHLQDYYNEEVYVRPKAKTT